jgi:hypothetical protein
MQTDEPSSSHFLHLVSVERPTEEDYAGGLRKQQLVMEFDMSTWRQLIEVYDIRTSVVPTRKAETGGDTWTRK